MRLKEHILIAWIIAGRFIADAYSYVISGDILALILVVILAAKYPKSHVPKIALLITLSVMYHDILSLMEIRTDLSIIAIIGAFLTLLISFTPIYGNSH